MPQRRGMATPMVRGMARTTGSAASGVNAMGQSADSGDRRPSGSRRSSRRAAVYRQILDVLDCSVDGRERDRPGERRSRLETLGNNDNSLHQFRKVGFEDAKSWMERRLANLRSGIPNSVATQLASGWARQLSPELQSCPALCTHSRRTRGKCRWGRRSRRWCCRPCGSRQGCHRPIQAIIRPRVGTFPPHAHEGRDVERGMCRQSRRQRHCAHERDDFYSFFKRANDAMATPPPPR